MVRESYLRDCFFSGCPIELECGFTIYQPTLKEINEKYQGITYEDYSLMISYLTRYGYEFWYQFNFEDEDYKSYTAYDMFNQFIYSSIFSNQSEENFVKLSNCISLIFGSETHLFLDDNGIRVLDIADEENPIIYNNENSEEVRYVLSQMMFFTKPKQRIFKNTQAFDLAKRVQIRRVNESSDVDFYSIATSLTWSKNSSCTYKDLMELTPHQILEGYYYVQKDKNYEHVMNGIYTGSMSAKDINLKEIKWEDKIIKGEK